MKKLHLIHYGPGPTSVSEQISKKLLPKLSENFKVDELNLIKTQPAFFDKQSMEAYVHRNYLGNDLPVHLSESLLDTDQFTDRLLAAEILVMIFPMYNFAIPGIIKTWLDNVLQAKKLFQYTEYGPIGLSKIQKAIVIPVTGSTPANSAKDFLTPYMEFILKFIGVKEVEFKGIYGTKFLGESVKEKIDEVVEQAVQALTK
jgi:FMN-dependent NADH-azoreductase